MVILFVLTASLVPLGALPGASAGPGAGVGEAASPEAGSTAYLPIARTPPPVLFADDFEAGTGQWTPFLNYKRLNPEKGAHDALTMVLVPGSEEWTDYRFRVRFRAESGRQAGVWFRGTYRDVETSGQWLTGYYFTVDVKSEGTGRAKLWQHRTIEEHGDEVHDYYWYHFSNPLFLTDKVLNTPVNYGEWHEITVEVDGPRIKCYVDDELAVNYVDQAGSIFLSGTVGLYTYGSDPRYAHVRFDDVLVEPLP
jgi:hypothetical protein